MDVHEPGSSVEAGRDPEGEQRRSGNDPCGLPTPPDPCTVIIFGASGDLTSRMLFPALARLFEVGALPERFAIVGAARTRISSVEFRYKMRGAIAVASKLDTARWDEFARCIVYQPLVYDSLNDYQALAGTLQEIETSMGLPGNRIFYLAIPPNVYEAVARMLGASGLSRGKGHRAWTRIVVEKPFGRDLASALALEAALHESFEEGEIFRIDHYLAKETIQNILLFRFANSVFEPLWNRSHIERVSILAAESLGVEHRAGYYEQAGVLRDMFQNHILQLLALAAMEPPSLFAGDRVGDEKAKVFRSLRPFEPRRERADLLLGQYTAGTAFGRTALGYREDKGVAPGSLTPTFALLRVHIDNWRWQGVPFYLTSGKRLAEKITRIVVQFKQVPHSTFRDALQEEVPPNRLILEISPSEGIRMSLEAKGVGPRLCVRTVALSYHFVEGDDGPRLDGYEKVLLDCMLGEHMLFLRQDSVELSWSFLTPILEMCDASSEAREPLHGYPAGSWGPEAAQGLHPGYLTDLGA